MLHTALDCTLYFSVQWPIQYTAVYYSTLQYSTVQYSAVQYSTVECSGDWSVEAGVCGRLLPWDLSVCRLGLELGNGQFIFQYTTVVYCSVTLYISILSHYQWWGWERKG